MSEAADTAGVVGARHASPLGPLARDQAGQAYRLDAALAGGAVVLVFYRGDW